MLISRSMATPRASSSGFQPYVSAAQSPAEFTARAIVIGVIFGLIFGASTVYLGLRAGLTVSASIPIAVLAISVLKRLGGSTILENNIVQTIGSAGESVAGGVVFTIPALIFLTPNGPEYFNYFQITMLTFAGGILGVLMMVPLRRALIVKEHGVLRSEEHTSELQSHSDLVCRLLLENSCDRLDLHSFPTTTLFRSGESVAGGVVFTIPALIFLTPNGPEYFNYFQITMLTFAGGILGVLMMVPLRRALIVKEHGVL